MREFSINPNVSVVWCLPVAVYIVNFAFKVKIQGQDSEPLIAPDEQASAMHGNSAGLGCVCVCPWVNETSDLCLTEV